MATEDSRIRELIDRRQYTRDANGTEAAQRTFAVFNAGNEAGALQIFNEYEDGKRFPGSAPFCVLDKADVVGQNGNTVWLVTASYSSFKGFVRRQPAEESNEFKPFWSWGYRKQTVEIPFANQITLLSESGQAVSEKLVFTVSKITVNENRLLRILKVKYQTNNVASLDVIAEQDRKIHEIRGKYYLFTGADVQQDITDPTIFFITYTWEYDSGTFMTATEKTQIYFDGDTVLNAPQDKSIAYIISQNLVGDRSFVASVDTYLIRDPYMILDVIAADSPERFPKGRSIELYDWDNLDGWRTLPGMVPV